MKLQFRGTDKAPDHYTFDGDVTTAYANGEAEDFDLSPLEYGDEFQGVEPELLSLSGTDIVRHAERDADGELWVTLCQRTIASQYPGRQALWSGRDAPWIDAADYDPNTCYVLPTGVSDLVEGEDYEIVWAEGRAPGEAGWTIRQPDVELEDAS